MGRDVVFQESPDDPGKRSRLWCHEDVLRVIRENLVCFLLNVLCSEITLHVKKARESSASTLSFH